MFNDTCFVNKHYALQTNVVSRYNTFTCNKWELTCFDNNKFTKTTGGRKRNWVNICPRCNLTHIDFKSDEIISQRKCNSTDNRALYQWQDD